MTDAVGLIPKEQAIALILNSPVKTEPEINIALFIACTALHGKKTWDGQDYDLHYLTVGLSNTQSRSRMVIGLLHDVIEDSDWTLDDLRRIGFSERVVSAVDALTLRKKEGEKYFDFIRRCSLNEDAIEVKLKDLKDNMSVSRNPGFPTGWQLLKQRAYIVSYQYLVAIKKDDIEAGSSIVDFVTKHRPDLYDANLLHTFSTEQLPSLPPPAPAATPRP